MERVSVKACPIAREWSRVEIAGAYIRRAASQLSAVTVWFDPLLQS